MMIIIIAIQLHEYKSLDIYIYTYIYIYIHTLHIYTHMYAVHLNLGVYDNVAPTIPPSVPRLKHLLARTRELLLEVDDFPASSAAKSAPLFRADWLGMFVSALARARCREDLPTLKQLLEIHFQKKILAGDLQLLKDVERVQNN